MKPLISFNFLTFFLIFFNIIIQVSGNNKQDSLKHQVDLTDDDYTKSKLLNDLSRTYLNKDNNEAIKIAQLALNIGRWNVFLDQITDSYRIIGYSYFFNDNYVKSLENYFNAVKYLKKTTDHLKLSKTYRDISLIYELLEMPEETIQFANLGIETLQKNCDTILLVDCYYFLGSAYELKGNHKKGIENFKKAIRLGEQCNLKMASEHNAIGITYFKSGQFETSLKYYQTYLKLSIENKDSLDIAMAYNNIGEVLREKGELLESIKYYYKAVPLRQSNISFTYLGLANTYSKLNNSIKAEHFLNLAKKERPDLKEFNKACKALLNNFRKLKNYDRAFHYNDILLALNDSLFSISTQDVKLAKAQYEVEGIEQRLAEKENAELLKENLEWQSKYNYALAAIAVLLLLNAIYFAYKLRKAQKANKHILSTVSEFGKSFDKGREDFKASLREIPIVRDTI